MAVTDASSTPGIQLPLVWVGLEEQPIQMLSNVIVQIQAPEEIIMSLGQTIPPVLTGTPEEQAQTAQRIPFVPVKALVSVSLTTNRVKEMLKILTEVLERHEETFGKGSEGG